VRIARQRVTEEDASYPRGILLNRAQELLDQQPPPEPERFYLQASISVMTGRTAEALNDYARAIELNPNEASWRFDYAMALVREGRLEEAREQAVWCARRDPQHGDYRQLLERIHQLRLRQP
jgi:Flp pilus assembly protein TadD